MLCLVSLTWNLTYLLSYLKIYIYHTRVVTRDQFVSYWIDKKMVTMDLENQIFTVLRNPDKNYLTQDDFEPILRELLATHPGL